jgi:hypothetical protein
VSDSTTTGPTVFDDYRLQLGWDGGLGLASDLGALGGALKGVDPSRAASVDALSLLSMSEAERRVHILALLDEAEGSPLLGPPIRAAVEAIVDRKFLNLEAGVYGGEMPPDGWLAGRSPHLSVGTGEWSDGNHRHMAVNGRIDCQECFDKNVRPNLTPIVADVEA